MIRTQVYIPDDLYREAKLYAETSGISISEILRDGLKDGVKKRIRRAKKKKFTLLDMAGKYHFSGKKRTNAGATHNDIYDL